VPWGDVNARARGLATHLLDRVTLEHLARSTDLRALAERMLAAGVPLDVEGLVEASPAELDRAIGRAASSRLAVLERWLGPRRRAALAVLFERFDVDNLRRLLRAAVQGASPAARLRGMLPTPSLPERALERLAEVASIQELSGALVRLGHPAGRVLAPHRAGTPAPSLLDLELALLRLYVTRAGRFARRGDRLLREYVERTIDLHNARSLLLREHWGDRLSAAAAWLPGGRALQRPGFLELAALADARVRRDGLARRFPPPLLNLLADRDVAAPQLETRALGLLLMWLRATALREPLSSAPTLLTLLRIEAETRDLRSLVWGIAMRAPASLLSAGLLAA